MGAEVERLRGEVEELRRAGKRQAAPFSKGDPKANPARSGRRSGAEHGRHAHRPVPDHVDEEIRVPLPDGCPACGGELEFEGEMDQYQEDLVVPVRAHTRRFRVAHGHCRRCGRRAQGRHPLQTSDALGAAGCQVGPNALALAAQLNKELGIPASKVARALATVGAIKITAGGVHQALARLARSAAATYAALVRSVRSSHAVAADETGWRVAGRRKWLWVFVGDDVTVYLIAEGRGYEQATSVLGEDFSGVLERDGWAPYRRFEHARHQTCLAHLLRRCGELIADSRAGQARVPHAVRRLLLDALALRDEHAEQLRRHDDRDDVIEGHAVEIDRQPAALPAPKPPTGDIKQFSLHHVTRIPQRGAPYAWTRPLVFTARLLFPLSFDARLGIRSRNLPPSSSRLNRGYSKAPRGAGFISLIALAGQRSTPRRLRRPPNHAVAERGAGIKCLSGGRLLASSGDWASGIPAFAISHGSRGTSALTLELDHRFPNMLLSLSPCGSG
ncbi:MAG: IS66 family transposase [Solirubrobacteraceae bacterium]